MSNPDNKKTYAALGLSPNASLDQVKSRYLELANIYDPAQSNNDETASDFRRISEAYNKILELSQSGSDIGAPIAPTSANNSVVQPKPQPSTNPKQRSSPPQKTHTEPIATIKARLAKGEIQKAQFEKLAKERYNYLKNKSFSELSDSEFEERLHGFEGLRFL
jgi:curved DNA-binding protein CbpA